jgi:hypothetical protein
MPDYIFNINSSEEKVWTIIGETSVCIFDCKNFPKRKQIKEIIDKIYAAILDKGYSISRSKKSMCGELYFHILCAKFKIAYSSAKHADLEYSCDSRWYVRFFSNILSILF